MEENYRWIKVRFCGNGEEISVRQSEADRGVFFDADGRVYAIDELDFSHISEEDNALMNSYMKSQEDLRRMNEEHERTQNQLREMLASMDAKAIADHQSVIDEAAYWRKLRGEIFMKVLERGGEFTKGSELEWAVKQTDINFRALYEQHQKFLTEKQK